jgi:hypothetical protein
MLHLLDRILHVQQASPLQHTQALVNCISRAIKGRAARVALGSPAKQTVTTTPRSTLHMAILWVVEMQHAAHDMNAAAATVLLQVQDVKC